MNPTKKPVWPHGDVCRMSVHAGSGQWYRCIRGKNKYFGVLRDPDAALQAYLTFAKADTGRDAVAVPVNRVTLDAGLNHFLTARQVHAEFGDLSAGQFVRYRNAVRFVFSILDRKRLITDLGPHDFERVKAAIKGSPRTVANVIRDIRVGFKWVGDFYRAHPAFGQSFQRPSARAVRAGSTRRRLFTAEEIRKLLAASEANMRPMILLAINCGFGQTDCAFLRRDKFDLCGHWFPRPKTDIERRCPFWPATITAINCARRWRPDLRPELLFLSKYGKVLVRDDAKRNKGGDIVGTRRKDAIQQMFRRCCERAGVVYRPFYTLRHTFRSIADRIPDATAIRVIMGHALPGMDGVYVQLAEDGGARLKVVTDAVHAWLSDGETPG